jgi:hypothetical protein
MPHVPPTSSSSTGFTIARKIKERILKYERINDRICNLRMKWRYRNVTIISAHAPTEERDKKGRKKSSMEG